MYISLVWSSLPLYKRREVSLCCTGRAGDKDGVAYTLITQKEARFAGELVNSLIAAGQNVLPELTDIAMKVNLIILMIPIFSHFSSFFFLISFSLEF